MGTEPDTVERERDVIRRSRVRQRKAILARKREQEHAFVDYVRKIVDAQIEYESKTLRGIG